MQAGNALPLALGIQRDVIDSSGVPDAPSSGCGAAVRFADKSGRDAEVTVLVLRYLRDAGFHDAYKALVNDSGISLDQLDASDDIDLLGIVRLFVEARSSRTGRCPELVVQRGGSMLRPQGAAAPKNLALTLSWDTDQRPDAALVSEQQQQQQQQPELSLEQKQLTVKGEPGMDREAEQRGQSQTQPLLQPQAPCLCTPQMVVTPPITAPQLSSVFPSLPSAPGTALPHRCPLAAQPAQSDGAGGAAAVADMGGVVAAAGAESQRTAALSVLAEQQQQQQHLQTPSQHGQLQAWQQTSQPLQPPPQQQQEQQQEQQQWRQHHPRLTVEPPPLLPHQQGNAFYPGMLQGSTVQRGSSTPLDQAGFVEVLSALPRGELPSTVLHFRTPVRTHAGKHARRSERLPMNELQEQVLYAMVGCCDAGWSVRNIRQETRDFLAGAYGIDRPMLALFFKNRSQAKRRPYNGAEHGGAFGAGVAMSMERRTRSATAGVGSHGTSTASRSLALVAPAAGLTAPEPHTRGRASSSSGSGNSGAASSATATLPAVGPTLAPPRDAAACPTAVSPRLVPMLPGLFGGGSGSCVGAAAHMHAALGMEQPLLQQQQQPQPHVLPSMGPRLHALTSHIPPAMPSQQRQQQQQQQQPIPATAMTAADAAAAVAAAPLPLDGFLQLDCSLATLGGCSGGVANTALLSPGISLPGSFDGDSCLVGIPGCLTATDLDVTGCSGGDVSMSSALMCTLPGFGG